MTNLNLFNMRKYFLVSLLALAFVQVNAQSNCDDDVVENLDAEIQLSAQQVVMTWDYNYPFDCGFVPCPPGLVYYVVEVQYGWQFFGSGGPVTWFDNDNFKIARDDTQGIHSLTLPMVGKFSHFRYRVQVLGCSNWDGWVEVSI